MANEDFEQSTQQPQSGEQQQRAGGGRKNTDEVGEPVQLQEDMPKQGQQPGKPGMGQREGQQGGQHQGGGQQGGQHQGGTANR